MPKYMVEKIKKINQSIEIEKNRLREYASRLFDAIIVPSTTVQSRNVGKVSGNKTPGLTYVLYVVAVLFAILAFVSDDSVVLYVLLAVGCVIGGYMFSKRNALSSINSTTLVKVADINSIKTNTISKGIDSVKKITRDWDCFMENKQKEVFAIIDSSTLTEPQKEDLSSKIFSYEVIDINLSELMSMINSASSIPEVQQNLSAFKTKFISALGTAADRQEKKYRSLIDQNLT